GVTRKDPRYVMILHGAMLGFITGGVGAGGGFLIIPALVNFYGMPIMYAVATSLAIISFNSFFGLAGDLEKRHLFDWSILVPYRSEARRVGKEGRSRGEQERQGSKGCAS